MLSLSEYRTTYEGIVLTSCDVINSDWPLLSFMLADWFSRIIIKLKSYKDTNAKCMPEKHAPSFANLHEGFHRMSYMSVNHLI